MTKRRPKALSTRMKEENRYRATVVRALRKWRPITGTDRWTINVDWASDEPKSSMCITAQSEYFDAEIGINMQYLVKNNYLAKLVEYDVVHELCHLFISHLNDYAERGVPQWVVSEVNEQTTSRIARALWVAHYREEPPARSDINVT